MLPDYLDGLGGLPFYLGFLLGGYLIGGLPFGLWVGRAFGVGDVRAQGSGNIGAANLARSGGWRPGLLTLLLDAAKGFVPAAIAFELLGGNSMAYAGLGAFLGHCFSPYLGFQGGKGIATAFGVFLAWDPINALICLGVWLIVAAISRRASVASLATIAAAVAAFFFRDVYGVLWALPIMGAVAVWRHSGNIERLLNGTEPRIALKKSAGKTDGVAP